MVVVVADGQNTVVEVKMSVVVVVYGIAGTTVVLVQPQSVIVEVWWAVRVKVFAVPVMVVPVAPQETVVVSTTVVVVYEGPATEEPTLME